MKLLEELLAIEGTSGDEGLVTDYLVKELEKSRYGLGLSKCTITDAYRRSHRGGTNGGMMRVHDNLLVWKGVPKTAIFSHMDIIGFMVGHGDALTRVGGPAPADGNPLIGTRDGKTYKAIYLADDKYLSDAPLPTGIRLMYDRKPQITKKRIRSAYLDDRAGVYIALKAFAACNDVALAFTTYEEEDGKGARVCAKILHDELGITQALVSDITWHTKDIKLGKGPVISLRDGYIPRQSYVNRVVDIARASGIKFQLETETAGGSDGGHLQRGETPIDWCFVGPCEKDAHSINECLDRNDLVDSIKLYGELIRKL